MSFDSEKYLPGLDTLDLNRAAKLELIHSLEGWAQAFVARSFGDLPAQHVQKSYDVQDSKAARDAVGLSQAKANDGGAS